MPMPRPIDSTLHGATDYSVGTLLMTVFPKLAGIEGTRSASQIRTAGAIHAGYSTVTDYPLGVVKLLPYKAPPAGGGNAPAVQGAPRDRRAGGDRAGRDALRHRPVEEGP